MCRNWQGLLQNFQYIIRHRSSNCLSKTEYCLFFYMEVQSRWQQGIPKGFLDSAWTRLDRNNTNSITSHNRVAINRTFAIIMGHCLFGIHGEKLVIFSNDFSRRCVYEEEETTTSGREESLTNLLAIRVAVIAKSIMG